MAPRRVAPRGRAVVALALAAFLLVTTSIVWRRSVGSAAAGELHRLATRHAELATQRAELERDLRRAMSREQLVPAAQRLGMRVPDDSQVIHLPRPDRGRGP